MMTNQIKKTLSRHDLFRDLNDNPKLIVLHGCDGGVSHAISVVGNVIFDSNRKEGLVVSNESLDWYAATAMGGSVVFMPWCNFVN